MVELPLFPLNTVLFPNMPLQLHIFEDRYKRMIGLCIQEHRPFGVALIRYGLEAYGPLAEPYRVGCSAEIQHVRKLQGGRMNILAKGKERFRILSLNRETLPYLVGTVEPYPLAISQPDQLKKVGSRLRVSVLRYIYLLSQASQTQSDMGSLPQDPISLIFYAAALVQVPPDQKQQLLETQDAFDLFVSLQSHYRREILLLKTMLESRIEQKGSFSTN